MFAAAVSANEEELSRLTPFLPSCVDTYMLFHHSKTQVTVKRNGGAVVKVCPGVPHEIKVRPPQLPRGSNSTQGQLRGMRQTPACSSAGLRDGRRQGRGVAFAGAASLAAATSRSCTWLCDSRLVCLCMCVWHPCMNLLCARSFAGRLCSRSSASTF